MTLIECCTRALGFLQAEWIPMLADCTAPSILLSKVVREHPLALDQSPGGRPDILTARWVRQVTFHKINHSQPFHEVLWQHN